LAERKGGIVLGPAGIAFVAMGEVLREWDDLEEAERVLRKGIDLCHRGLEGFLAVRSPPY